MNPQTDPMLAAELCDIADDRPAELNVSAIKRRGRALRRRRVAFTGAAGSALAVAAAVAGLVVVGPGQGAVTKAPAEAGSASAAATPVPSAAVLAAQVTAAFDKARASSELTVHAILPWGTATSVTVPSQGWEEDVDFNQASAHTNTFFAQRVPGAGAHAGDYDYRLLFIDFTNRTYHMQNAYVRKGLQTQWFTLPQPQSLKETAYSTVVASGHLNGQPVYIIDGKGSGGFTDTEWVSKKTLLVLKEVDRTKGSGTQVYDYTWSSASGVGATAAANVPAAPQGFTQN